MAMKSPQAQINPNVLQWARKALGYSAEVLSSKLKIKPDVYQKWEQGQQFPSFAQLKKIADVLKRPSSIFFLRFVPQDFPIPSDFRVLDETEIPQLAPKTLLEIRKAQRKRQLAIDLMGELEEELIEFTDSANLRSDIPKLAQHYRKLFGIDKFEDAGWQSEWQALGVWKAGIESLGILVLQASLESLDEMRGLAIYNKNFPIILLNTKDSPRGKMFSLLHEFCHLLLRKSGIGNIDPNWQTKGKVNPVEVFCNEFAGECLVPANKLKSFVSSKGLDPATVATDKGLRAIVNMFQASWDVALRRLLEEQYISLSAYRSRRKEMLEAFARKAKTKSSGPVPIEQRALAYNGDTFTSIVLAGYDQQRLTSADLVDYLGVSYKHLDKVRNSLVRKVRGA